MRRSAHLKGGCGTPLKVVETWLLLQRSLTSSLFSSVSEHQGTSGTTSPGHKEGAVSLSLLRTLKVPLGGTMRSDDHPPR